MYRGAMLSLAFAVLGCGGLSKDQARTLLEEQFAQIGPRSCVWTHASDGGYTDVDYMGIRECVQALEKAGIAKPGACRDKGEVRPGATCISRSISALGDATLTNEGLTFHCGDVKLLTVKYIDKVSAEKAEVSYDRDFQAPLLKEIEPCASTVLRHPDAGRQGKDVMFMREDGVWRIASLDWLL